MAKKKIPEIRYRASRICRAMGNPTAYEVLHILKKGERTPEELAKLLGVSLPTISQVLRSLRDLDLVRYEVKWRNRIYWIKTDVVVRVMTNLEQLVKIIENMK
ncbi:MAG: ArsR family transcriptional regulator [Candidatus Stahlbacteria bacterium]|jgi:DNA-binding transcriptional ArsR family regulator|nr:winged helix-turn-helix transcriptional regulator [candidate division WOR-3 bacterium]MCK4672959.1 winged helix-turn-helix transcriptional regulator [candidate division WOR-3 bacterium]NOR17197.1 ArsR family transcriptional regulator [candidate division WOR-3 bacterium]TET59496.1 MAG: ArsR family transcriptional regulator [Candidatus Stahlbacteria bacterium]